MVVSAADGKTICVMSGIMVSIRGIVLIPMDQRLHIAHGLYIHDKTEAKNDTNKYVRF